MNATQARNFVRVFITSGGSNPPEPEFTETMAKLTNVILDELAQYCDQLISNFTSIHGPDAPGIVVAQNAKRIIIKCKK